MYRICFIAALLLCLGAAPSTQPISPSSSSSSSQLLHLKLALAFGRTKYGEKYPAIIQMEEMISMLESHGAKIDPQEVNDQLNKTVILREQMLSTQGLRDAHVVEVTREIEYLAQLLTGDLK